MKAPLTARDLAQVAVFAALIAVLGWLGTLYPFGAVVPITAQTLGVMLAGSILGPWRGLLAVAAFQALVLAGLPLLAGGRGGLGVYTGPTAGFLIGWLAGVVVIGLLAGPALRGAVETPGRSRTLVPVLLAANAIGGIAAIYAFGVPVLAARTHVSLGKALTGSAVYLPGDTIKVVVAAVVTAAVVRGYPKAIAGR